MTQTLVWHQTFSNYHNLKCQLKQKQQTQHCPNITSDAIYLELSNEFDSEPLHVEQIAISEHADFSDKKIFSLQGQEKFQVPPYKKIWTDMLSFSIQAGKKFYIELTAKNKKGWINTLGNSLDTSFIEVMNSVDTTLDNSFFFGITSIAAKTSEVKATVGFFGDSLTNQGYFSNSVAKKLYRQFPNEITTLNAGVSGNRLLLSGNSSSEWNKSFGAAGVKRFYSDILSYQPNIVIFMEGINDLFHPGAGSPKEELPNTEDLCQGIKILSDLCSKQNCFFIPMTITPFYGSTNSDIHSWNPQKELIRKQVNNEIMKLPYAIDLATFVSDKRQKYSLDKTYDSGDHIHFSKTGGELIGKFIYTKIQPLIQKKISIMKQHSDN